MLSMRNVSAAQGQHYYSKDNYYSKSATRLASQWWGRGAQQLGLSGQVQKQQFKVLLEGYSGEGQQLRAKKKNTQGQNRAALDMTFSAPKSVSLAALVGGDRRLEEAHRTAVNRTLELVQSRYAQTRVRINGDRQSITTGKLIVAQYHHDTSREKEPQLHTHCVVINTTQLENGKWQSLHADSIWRHSKLIGQIYQNELACEVQRLGYEIEPRAHGQFELKGYTTQQLKAFSTRRQQIVNLVGENASRRDKELACLATRQPKGEEVAREELLAEWHWEVEFFRIKHPVPQPGRFAIQDATAAVRAGILHCSEREAGFKREAIEKFVLAEVGQFSFAAIQTAIDNDAQLIQTFDRRYTTQQALGRELATIRLMQEGKAQVLPIASKEQVERYLENKTLTPGQQQAIALSTITTDRVVAWQGVAGAGKTYALNEFRQIAQACGYTLKGYAPSAETAKVLEQEVGIESTTVAYLLASGELERFLDKQIWIVDEAGLLSAKDAYALLQRATLQKARVILVGDTRQLSAVEAGNPFRSLQNARMQTAHLNQSLRQRTLDLNEVVDLIAQGKIEQGIERLDSSNRITVIPDTEQRLSQIVQDYIALAPDEREATLVLAGTNQERLDITQRIREELKKQGILGETSNLTQLKPKDLTQVQARYVHHYTVGDVVVPTREYKRLGLTKFQPYTVEALDKNSLTLRAMDGTRHTIDPMAFRKTVYTQQSIEIAVGDRLRWTRNDRERSRRNGQEFTVVGIDQGNARIQYKNGLTDKISLSQPQQLDYALVSTTYSSQGKTADRVLIAADSTIGKESFYVALSRAKYELKLYTEDKADLLERAQKTRAKENPLELLLGEALKRVATEPVVRAAKTAEPSSVAPEKTRLKRDQFGEEKIGQGCNWRTEEIPEWPTAIESKLVSAEPVEAFWIPGSSSQREPPPHIEPSHWRELVEGSPIHPEIAARNFNSLQVDSLEQEHEACGYLMYSEKLERTNTGRLSPEMLKRYCHIEAGGWWCSAGVDSRFFKDLQPGQRPTEHLWGCYKPNAPRENPHKPGKKIKYEHPPKADLSIFLLDVPNEIAERIYEKAGVSPAADERTSGFWYCIWKHNVPITITEGAKKAASLLSQGRAAIGLPGIYAGYRSKDEYGLPIKACLMEELAVFATKDREIRICFDYETRPDTKRNIDIAISRTGSLLEHQGAKVSVVNLPGPEKGVDDFIVAQGSLAYEKREREALPLWAWRARNNEQRAALEPPKKLSFEERKQRRKAKLADKPAPQGLAVIKLEQTAELAASHEFGARTKSEALKLVETPPDSFVEISKPGSFSKPCLRHQSSAPSNPPAPVEQLSQLIQQSALETAQAVQQMLKNIGKANPDGSVTFEATQWRFAKQGNLIAITVKHDQREILRVEGDKPTVFRPNLEEIEKLKQFREQVAKDGQKQQQQQQRRQGPSR
jgi:conjugative relaxase-like TrwC/TraI family protein